MLEHPCAGLVVEQAQPPETMIDENFKLVPMSEALNTYCHRVEQGIETGYHPRRGYGGPLSVHWEFTNRCNLQCVFCYNASTASQGQHLPDERLLALTKELAELSVLEVTFSGGEVLMEQKRLWLLAERLQQSQISMRLITNGWFLTTSIAARLARTGFSHVIVSLDASAPSVHDGLRKVAGSWRHAVLGIGSLLVAGLPCSVTCVLTRQNMDSVEQLVEICDLLAVQSITFEDVRDEGRGLESCNRLRLSDREYEDVYLRLQKLRNSGRNHCRIVFGASTRFALDIMTLQQPFTCCIRANGEVVPVEALPVPYGDLKIETFRESWTRLVEAYTSGEIREHVAEWQTTVTPTFHIARSVKNLKDSRLANATA